MTEIKRALLNLRRILEKGHSDHGIVALLEQVEILTEHVDALTQRVYALEHQSDDTP
jgi:hypothetical protein